MVARRDPPARGCAQRPADRARRRGLRPARAATAPTSPHRRSTPWPTTGSGSANFHTTALCSPTRACLLTGRNHHRNGLGRVADLAMGYPGYNGEVPKENGFLSEILRARGVRHLRRGQMASHPRRRDEHGRAPVTWPLGRGFDRWYGFHGGETHQFVPALYHDNHAMPPPRSIEEGYHLSADLADQAIAQLGDLRAVDVDRPFFLYFCTGACHSPHHAPLEWIERYRGSLRRGLGRSGGRQTFARQQPTGLLPTRAPSWRRARHWVPAWDDLPTEDTAGGRPVHGVLRRLPLLHRRPAGPGAGLPRADRGRATTRWSCWSPTTGPAPRAARTGRSTTTGSRTSTRPGPKELGPAHRRARWAQRPQQLPVGLDHGRQHALQAVEARGPRRRGGRPLHRVLAGPDLARRRRHPPSVHPRRRHPPDRPRAGRRSRPRRRSSYVPQTPARRHELRSAAWAGRGEAAPGHRDDPILRDARQPCHLPRGMEGGHLQTHRARLQRRPQLGTRRSARTGGSSTTWPRIQPRCTTSPTRSRSAWPSMVERWWVEARSNQVLPARQPGRCTRSSTPSPIGRPPRHAIAYYPGTSPVPEPVAANVKNRSHVIEADVTVPPDGPVGGRAAGAGIGARGILPPRVGRSAALRAQPLRQGTPRRGRLGADAPRSPPALSYRSSSATRTGAAGPRIPSTGAVVAEGTLPAFTVAAFSATGSG